MVSLLFVLIRTLPFGSVLEEEGFPDLQRPDKGARDGHLLYAGLMTLMLASYGRRRTGIGPKTVCSALRAECKMNVYVMIPPKKKHSFHTWACGRDGHDR
jgi:hypothetical protein